MMREKDENLGILIIYFNSFFVGVFGYLQPNCDSSICASIFLTPNGKYAAIIIVCIEKQQSFYAIGWPFDRVPKRVNGVNVM